MSEQRPETQQLPQIARIQEVADKIRALLNTEDQSVAVSALALVCGEVLGSIEIAPPYTRMMSLQLFFQQVADIEAKTEDRRQKRAPSK